MFPPIIRQSLFRLLQKPSSSLPKLLRSMSSANGPDYYAVLGVNQTATTREIKMAYLERAKKYHPDTNRSDEARWMFELAAEAYGVLADEEKKESYDTHGHSRVFGGTSGGPARARGSETYSSEEIFSKIFGDSKDHSQQFEEVEAAESCYGTKSTKEHIMNLSFEEAALGCPRTIELNLKVVCPKCDGTKSAWGYTWQVCMFCEGTGMETEKVGHVLSRRPCSHCGGSRQYIKNKCDNCDGVGATIMTHGFTVDIPAGVEDGQVLSIPLDSNPYNCTLAETGNIYVYLRVGESETFQRSELNVTSQADACLSQALLGGKIPIQGLRTPLIELEIPSLFGLGRSLCLEGLGIARSDGRTGSHFVKVGLKVPETLTAEQTTLLRRFALADSDSQVSGTVEGIASEMGHKFELNAITPDKVERKFQSSVLQSEDVEEVKKNEKKREREKLFNKIFFGGEKKAEL